MGLFPVSEKRPPGTEVWQTCQSSGHLASELGQTRPSLGGGEEREGEAALGGYQAPQWGMPYFMAGAKIPSPMF